MQNQNAHPFLDSLSCLVEPGKAKSQQFKYEIQEGHSRRNLSMALLCVSETPAVHRIGLPPDASRFLT